MVPRFAVRSALIVLVLVAFTASLSAQRVELYPNAGGFWPNTMGNDQKIKSEGIYGLKGGVFVSPNSQIEGSFGYINHFKVSQPPNASGMVFGVPQPAVRGLLYDVNYAYNFGERQFLNTRVSPFVSFGGGGLTAHIPNAPSTFIEGGGSVLTPSGAVIPNTGRTKIMENGDTFFTVNYGVGVKFLNVAGPMGFRVDVRARTLPNFLGQTTTWLEPTAGLTFSWGER